MTNRPKFPMIIAHRGASAYAPENTMAAFKKALLLGAEWVEFDVRLTQDEELVILHDETLDRTTDGTGRVEEHTWDEIRQFDAGSWFSDHFVGEKVPHFSEVLAFLKSHHLCANVEMKSSEGACRSIARETVSLLNQSGIHQNTILLSSFEFDSLQYTREESKDIAIGMLFEELPEDWYSKAELIKPVSIHLNEEYVTSEVVSEICSKGFQVFVYTVNDAKRAHQLLTMGVSSLFSNYPDLI